MNNLLPSQGLAVTNRIRVEVGIDETITMDLRYGPLFATDRFPCSREGLCANCVSKLVGGRALSFPGTSC